MSARQKVIGTDDGEPQRVLVIVAHSRCNTLVVKSEKPGVGRGEQGVVGRVHAQRVDVSHGRVERTARVAITRLRECEHPDRDGKSPNDQKRWSTLVEGEPTSRHDLTLVITTTQCQRELDGTLDHGPVR